MKKIFYIIILITTAKQFFGQEFQRFKQTEFYFTSTNKKLKGRTTTNAYIKKGDSILILNKTDLNNFLILFENDPISFNDLFEHLPYTKIKDSLRDKFDKILWRTRYKIQAIIGTIFIHEDNNEIIWDIDNSDYYVGSSTCFVSILFNMKNKQLIEKNKLDNLEYIKIVNKYCDY